MNWINVKNELPPNKEKVLVLVGMLGRYEEKYIYFYDFGYYSTQKDILFKVNWVTSTHTNEAISFKQEKSITIPYWAPLPKFPPEIEDMVEE